MCKITGRAQLFFFEIHIVFGNNDGDLYRITSNAARFDHVNLHGEFAQLDLGGLRIAVTHYPEVAHPIVSSGDYAVICYGHNHVFHMQQVERTWLLNPGPVMGYNPLTGADVPSSFIVYETESNEAEGFQISEAGVSPIS